MSRTEWRAAGSIAGGAFVALALFLFMNTLISGGRGQQAAASAGQIVDLIRVQEDEVVQTKRRIRPRKPPPPKDPPPPPKLRVSSEAKPQRNPIRIDLPRIDVSGAAGGGPFIGKWEPGDPAAEGDAIPIARIDPQWPREALMDGTEGYVRFRILIGADGSVKDTKVIEAAPGRLFVRNATRAVRRWTFKPRVVDGAPVERWANTTLVFQLGDD